MVLIYIRHANDDDKNSTFRDDAKLNDKGVNNSKKHCKYLIKKYGVPSVIVCSPFIRARETAHIFKKYIRKTFRKKIHIKIEPILGRFFSSNERHNPDIRNETLKYKPIIEKSSDDLMKRLESHKEKMTTKNYHSSEEVIWCISHGIIMAKLMKLYKIKGSKKHVEFLQHFKVAK